MVRSRTTYYCEKCGKPFGKFRDAEKCEIGHIVQTSIDGFSSDLSSILTPAKHKGAKRE